VPLGVIGAMTATLGLAVAVGFVFARGGTGEAARSVARGTTGTRSPATAPRSSAEPARNIWTAPPQTDPDIDDEKTDRRPLTVDEVFPHRPVTLAGRTYTRDKASTTSPCAWSARGQFADSLTGEGCRLVVRSTFFDARKKFAVTTGVAVLPSGRAAQTSSVASTPNRSGWFRGMRGRTAGNIDEADGVPAGVVKGRYIVYAFATYFDGHPPDGPADPALTEVSRAFVGFAARAVDRRATHSG
jgi:hypothetical protein